MKTKTTLKRRLLSGLLALVMVLGFLPAELLTLPAQAVSGLKLTIDDIDPDTGEYSVTVSGNGVGGTAPGRWAFALVPAYLTGDGGIPLIDKAHPADPTNALYGRIITASATQTKGAMAQAIAGTNLPSSIYVVDGGNGGWELLGSGSSYSHTFTGNLPDFESIKNALGSWSGDTIEYRAVLITVEGDREMIQSVDFPLKAKPKAQLSGGPYTVTATGSPAAYPATYNVVVNNVSKDADANVDWSNSTIVTDTTGASERSTITRTPATNVLSKEGSASLELTISAELTTNEGAGLLVIRVPYVTNGSSEDTRYADIQVNLEFPGVGKSSAEAIVFTVEAGSSAPKNNNLPIKFIDKDGQNEIFYDANAVGAIEWQAPADDGLSDANGLTTTVSGLDSLPTTSYTNLLNSTYTVALAADPTWIAGTVINDYLFIPYAAGYNPDNGWYTDATTGDPYEGEDPEADGAIWNNGYDIYGKIAVPITINVIAPTGPRLEANPTFARWTTAGNGTAVSFALTEMNNVAANIVSIALDSTTDFTLTKNVGNSIGAGATANNAFTVAPKTTPAGGNNYSANVIVTYNDGKGGANQTISIPVEVDVAVSNFTVKFNLNKPDNATGTPNPSSYPDQTVTQGNKATTPTPAPTLTKFVFQGWNTKADGTGTALAATNIQDNTTFYAQWEELYTVSFNLNRDGDGGTPATLAPIPQTTVGGTITLHEDVPTRTGGTKTWVFAGWKVDGSGTTYDAGDDYQPTADVTMVAQWAETYAIVFHENWPSGSSTADQSGAAPATISNINNNTHVPAPSPIGGTMSVKGYKFGGWSTTPTGTTAVSWPYTVTDNVKLYAIWTELPEISGATGGTPKAGQSFSLTGIQLSNGTTLTPTGGHWVGAGDWVPKAEWYLGGSAKDPVTDGPKYKGDLLASGTATVTVPSNASQGDCLWVKLGGNGTDVKEKEKWVAFPVGEDKLNLTVNVVVLDTAGNIVPTPGNITASQGTTQLSPGGNTSIRTTNVNSNYAFKGWSVNANGSNPQTAAFTDAASWRVDSFSPNPILTDIGVNSATFTAPGTLSSSMNVALYAVYRALPTDSLEVSVVLDGTAYTGSDITVAGGRGSMKGGETSTITANTTAPGDYVFLGWSTNANGSNPVTSGSAGNLSGISTNAAGGSAVFKMPSTPINAKIYAVYRRVSSYTVHIVLDPGVASVDISGGTPTKLTATGDITVKEGQTITVVTNPDDTHEADGFAHTGDGTGSYGSTHTGHTDVLTDATTSFMATITGNGLTVEAKAKLKPPVLQLTPTAGTGSVDGGVAKKPEVAVSNIGGAGAKITKITIGNSNFSNDTTSTNVAVGDTIANTDTGKKIVLNPAAGLAAGTYTIPVTVTYTDPDGGNLKTATTNVTYVVTATNKFNGSVVVKIDGTAADAPLVTLSNASGVTSTPPSGGNGTTTFTGLSINQSHVVTVSIGGVSYPTNFSLSPDNTSVEVNFVTVTAKVDSADTNNTNAINSTSTTVTVGVDGTTQAVTSANLTNHTGVSKVVLKGSAVTLTAAISGIPGYNFEEWTKNGSQASTAATYTFVANENNKTYLAHLVKRDQVVLSYDGNFNSTSAPDNNGGSPVIGVPPAQTVDAGGTATVSSMKPVLGGYKFRGWANNSGDTTVAYAPGVSITNITGNKTIYALWEKAEITAQDDATLTATYGSGFNYTISASRNDGVTGLLYSQTNLPGGLTLNTQTGAISGIPYEVCTNRQVTITVAPAADTHYRDTSKTPAFQDTVTLTITVNPATPVITGISPVGSVVSGQPLNSVGWTVTVAGPRLTAGQTTPNNPSDDTWETYTDTITYNAATTPAAGDVGPNSNTAGVGKTTISTTDGKFATGNGPTTVNVAFAAQANGLPTSGSLGSAATDFDSAGHKQNAVWNNPNKDFSIAHNGNSPKIEVSTGGTADADFASTQSWLYATQSGGNPAHAGYTPGSGDDGFVTVNNGTTPDTVNAKAFKIRNSGTANTGALNYALTCSNGTYTFTQSHTQASLAAGADDTITVTPPADAPAGTYTGTLTVTGANGGTATIHVTFVVTNAKTFTGIVRISTQGVNDATASAAEKENPLGSTGTVKIGSNAATWDATDKCYKLTNLEVGKSYTVSVTTTAGDDVVPSAVLTSGANDTTVTMYQLTTDYEGTGGTAVTQSGAGWYVKDQYAAIGTPSSVTNSGTTYDFEIWKYDTNSTLGGTTANVKVEAPKNYTAVYKTRSADTVVVTYKDRSNTVITVTENEGATHSITSAQPAARAGYIFKGWNLDGTTTPLYTHTGSNNSYTLGTSDVTFNAVWEQATISWSPATGSDSWTYGVADSYAIPVPTVSDGASVVWSLKSSDVPGNNVTNNEIGGGIVFDPNTGTVRGTSYEVKTSHTIVVTATHSGDSTIHADYTLTLEVKKYTPVLSALTVANVVDGRAHTTATYTGVVTAPLLTTKGTTAADDVWTTTSWTVGYDGTASPATTMGPKNFTPTSSGNFTTGNMTVTLTYDPIAEAGTYEDNNGSTFDKIYDDTAGTITASLTNTYTMEVQTAPVGGTAGAWGASAAWSSWLAQTGYKNDGTTANGGNDTTNNKVSAQTFNLRNTGNQATGNLNVKWGTTGTDTGSFFTFATGSLNLTSGLATNGTGTFTIVPNEGLAKGTYQDILTITNANGGSVTVNVKMVVSDPGNYTVTVNTDHYDIGGTHGLKNLTAGNVVLTQTDDTTKTLTLAGTAGSNGVYTFSNAVYGKTYSVTINNYLVPNLTVSMATPTATVDLVQVTVKDEPSAGASPASSVAKGYVVRGENAQVNIGAAASGYSFKRLEDITVAAIPVVKTTTAGVYSQALTAPTAFQAVYALGLTLTYHADDATSGTVPAKETHVKDEEFRLASQGDLKRSGYVFAGWNTESDGSGTTYPAGSNFKMPATDTDLYAVWEATGGALVLPDTTITAYYGEALNGASLNAALGLTGTGTYILDPQTSDTLKQANWTPNLALDSGTLAITGTPRLSGVTTDSGTQTYVASSFITTKVTDGANSKTATGKLTVNVEKAKTTVKTAPTANTGTYLPGGTFALTDLASQGTVDALYHNDPNGTGASLQSNVPGTWAITDGATIGNGPTHTVTLTFTPYDDGFLPTTATVTIPVTKRVITAATVTVEFPKDADQTAQTNPTITAVTSAPTGAVIGDVNIKSVIWSGSGYNKDTGKFSPTKDIMLTVVLEPKNSWSFVGNTTDFTGTFADGNTGSTQTQPDVDISCSETEAVLTYTWRAADSDVENIRVRVDAPAKGGSIANNMTAICLGSPVGSFRPEIVKWVKDELSNVTSANYNGLTGANGNFETGKYTVIVKATKETGYRFTNIYAAPDNSNANATINSNNAKVLKNDWSNGEMIIAYEFEVEDNPIVGTSSASGPLVFYAQTGASDKHYNASATGNKTDIGFVMNGGDYTVNAVNSAGAAAQVSDYILFADMNGNGAYNAGTDVLLVTNTSTSAGSYTFSDIDPTHATTHGSDLNGKKLYALAGNASSTVYAALVGELVVKPLEAKTITSTSLGTVRINDGSPFAVPGNITVTTTVGFNTDVPGLNNSVATNGSVMTLGAKPTNGVEGPGTGDTRPHYYYMLDLDGNGTITDADLELNNTNTLTTAAHNGKGIYACYTDVNGTLVYTRVGTLGTNSSFTVDVTDENGHDPEYADKLTATPSTSDPGDYDYQWERKKPDGSGWEPIPGATGRDYRPEKDDVDETIRVIATDKTTGSTAESPELEIQPRSLNFTVDVKDKRYDGDAFQKVPYVAGDFHPTAVGTGSSAYGGVWGTDTVTITPAGTWNTADATRPQYLDTSGNAASAVGSEITWPAITENAGTAVGQIGGYTVGGTVNAAGTVVYRLRAQGEQENRGIITDGNVTHVDVSFKEVPIFNHTIPTSPMGVTDSRETRAGEASGNADSQAYVANWYTGAYTPGGSNTAATGTTFGADSYTVVVAVKPQTGYRYDANTKYYFHFGEDQHVEVTTGNGLYVNGGVYYMYHTFTTVDRPKIAHVNVSVPQPVVYGTPANGSVNQALGTDNSIRTTDVTMGAITWYKGATGTDTLSGGDQFQAGGTYRAEFDLTTTNSYKYLNKAVPADSNDVRFVISGVGPIEGAGHIGDNTTPANTVIESVTTTTTDADTTYRVVVVYKSIAGGRVALTDVVVDASRATAAGVDKTGPQVIAPKPYALTTTAGDNKWEYWNTTSKQWVEMTDSKFEAGVDYRVTAKVRLTDTQHYEITTGTKFYLAGLECTTTAEHSVVTGQPDYTPLVPSAAAAADGKYADTVTYTLIREFSIPANDIGMVTVTYDLPLNSGTAIPTVPESYGDTSVVDIANNATSWVKLGTADTSKNDFTSAGSAPGTTFAESEYYRVTSVVTPKTGNKFTSSTVVVINGVPVTVDGAEGEVKENGTTVAYVKAVTDGDNIKAMLIAKVRSTAIDPIELKHADLTPVAEKDPSSALFELAKAGEARYEVDTGVHNGGKGTWEYEDAPGHWTAATNGNGLDASGKFLSGTKYRVTVGVKTTGTNVFATGASGTVDNTANSTKKNAAVQVAADRKTATLTVTFDPTNIKTASVVDVYFRRQPEVGAHPTTLKDGDGNWIYKFPATVNNAPTETVGTLAGTGMEQFDVKWYDTTDVATFDPATNTKTAMGDSDAFGANKKYTVTVRVKPAAGWQYILDNDPNTEDTKFTIFASDAGHTSNNVWYDAANGNYVMWYTFTTSDDPKIIVRVSANATQPVAGAAIPTGNAVLLLARNKDGDDMTGHVTVGNMSWTLADGTAIPAGDNNKFVVGRQYKVTFDVTAKDAPTYPFLNDTATPDYVDFLINGVTNNDGSWIDGETTGVTQNDITVTTAKKNGSSDVYTVTVTFPKGATADLVVQGKAKVPVADTTIRDADITVDAAEHYKIVTGTNKWEHWNNGTGAWEPTTSGTDKFVAGDIYRATLTVQMKDVGTYAFTSTTKGYINDTTPYNGATTPKEGTDDSVRSINTANAANSTITLTREFRVPKQQVTVHVGADAPAYNIGPDTRPIDIHGGYKDVAPHFDKDKYTLSDSGWYKDAQGHTKMAPNEVFEEDKTYYLITTAKPKTGYYLSKDISGYLWVDQEATAMRDPFTINRDPAAPDEVTEARVVFSYYIPKKGESKSPELAVNIPRKGGSPTKPTSPNGSVFFGDDYRWTEKGSGTTVTSFTDDKTYVVTVYDPKKPDGRTPYAEGDTIQFNEKTATVTRGGDGRLYVDWEYHIPKETVNQGGGGGGTTVIEDYNVNYWLSTAGTSDDAIGEHVAKNKSPKNVPTVTALNGYTFLGWSLDNPAKVADPKLVDPKTVKITEDTTFYAIYKKDYDHSHYVIGFPDGTFGPDNNITRGQVATIIARACLDGFQEGANYGNPGGYSDVSEHWAYSAISYCSMHNVFTGYEDGTFRPDAAISRQELATAVARLGEMQTSTGVPFTDSADVAAWAQDAVYTAYANGWIKGYEDGTFLPENDIKRSETVTIFNGYLERTVNKEGLSELSEYVHSGVASNLQGGDKAYMTWPDVPESHWAYYEIIEAANDHDYHKADEADPKSTEMWETAKIDEIWRYHDDLDDGADRVDDLMNGTRLTAAEAKAQAEAEAKAKAEAEAKAKAEAEAAAKAAEEAAKAEAEAKAAEEAAKAEEEAAKAEEEAAKAEEEAAKAETNPSETMIHRAYINGFEDGTFRPDASITRAAVASVIAQTLLEGYDPDVTYDTDLVDLDEHWAKNYVAFCVQNGVFGGYEDNTFRPDQGISRQEFAVVLAKLSGLTGEGELTFSDSADVADWAASGVNAAVSKGWLKGYEDGTFLPEKLITRAEAVKIFNSYLGRGVNYNGLSGVPGGSIWSDVSPTHWAYLEIVEAANDHTYHWSDADDPTPPERWETAGEI